MTAYPGRAEERSRWIVSLRHARPRHNPLRPQSFFLEREPDERGRPAGVLTVLLTSRECPRRCVMCDLWKNTRPGRVSPGAIPAQIRHALARAGRAQPRPAQLKLYNSGSFFDSGAVPPEDYPAIAALAAGFERVIVECHPALAGDRVLQFARCLEQAARRKGGATRPVLEVAMGLETAHPRVLARLNKGMTLALFGRAARFLVSHRIALRAFVLVQPPFLAEAESLPWAVRSVEHAFGCGAGVVCLIPTRGGNGAMDALAAAGQFTPPRLATLEQAMAGALALKRGRVLADCWDLEKFSECQACFARRAARLRRMNLCQAQLPPIACARCGA